VTEDELRAMVRDSIARLGRRPEAAPALPFDVGSAHPSHLLLPLARGGDGDGACLIEPAVRCNHCGYCLAYGH
jgi:hypothetical protein